MKPGDKVSKGQLLMTVEGMKMEVRYIEIILKLGGGIRRDNL